MKGKLEQLHNVSVDDPANGSVLTYNADDGIWQAEGASSDLPLGDLSTAADGDVLTYDGTNWVAETPAGGALTYWDAAVSGSSTLTTTSTPITGLLSPTLAAGTYLVVASILINYASGDAGQRVRLRLRWGGSDAYIAFFDAASAHDEVVITGHRIVSLFTSGTVSLEASKDGGSGASGLPNNSQSRLSVIKIA